MDLYSVLAIASANRSEAPVGDAELYEFELDQPPVAPPDAPWSAAAGSEDGDGPLRTFD